MLWQRKLWTAPAHMGCMSIGVRWMLYSHMCHLPDCPRSVKDTGHEAWTCCSHMLGLVMVGCCYAAHPHAQGLML